jgi:hypothetical protein
MTTTYDFGDGNGPVIAHQHPNGGGWVSDSAQVDDSAFVGPYARVYGNARVSGNARVFGDAIVYGDARVSGDACVFGDALVFGDARVVRGNYNRTPASITRSDGYTFTMQTDGSIVAGCRDFAPNEADDHWGNPEHRMHAESWAIVQALRTIAAAREASQ